MRCSQNSITTWSQNKHDAAIQALFSLLKASHSDFECILNVFMDQDRQLFHSVSVFQIFPPIN